MTLSTADLRQKFFDYYKSHGHQVVASSSLVPADDPTLLFTNAGMNQFKDLLLGTEKRSYTRAVSAQRCVRAGGKHNDLENVGYTARHHTFFEMLGNFSFGDYFKKEAIEFSWTFLTRELGLPKEKLLVTVYTEDDEAFDIWENHIGVPKEKIIRISTSDNFWSMGDTGPCGPCSEIFYDHGEHIWGGPPGTPEEDGDRFIEIWNLVFMQYNKQADGSMEALPQKSIDTGMGLERIAAILQDVHSNYEIDLFQNLIKSAADVVGTTDLENKSLRVIADHIRSCSFLICDGVMPSNEGRGYVLRRIIRRAVRHGYKLGASDIFFYKLVSALAKEMGNAYPELVDQQPVVEKVLRVEEEQFSKTLSRGMAMLNDALTSLEDDTIPGDVVFKLYDTYGFPVDLTNDVAREHDLKIDIDGFDSEMAKQRERAQKASNFGADYNARLNTNATSTFTGYTETAGEANVVELIADDAFTDVITDGQDGVVILDATPFYAEAGGQVGDSGVLNVAGGEFVVTDTQKMGNAFAHFGKASGTIKKGDKATVTINAENREAIKKNHSATHLLHATLREVLGDHVAQKGSLVEAQRMRFDFSHFEALTSEQIEQIERRVNEEIRANHALTTQVMGLEEAKEAGAMALFGEKYDDEVRVVTMGPFSVELCGGTHVARTGDIGLFKIIGENGIASGVRRIDAVTGEEALKVVQQQQAMLNRIAGSLKTDVNTIVERISALQQQSKDLDKALSAAKQKLASQQGADLLAQAEEINGTKVLVAKLDGVEPKALRGMLDDIKNRMGDGVVVLGIAGTEKVNLIAGVTKSLTAKVKAGDLVNHVAAQVGGKGGGRPDMAQAGGDKPQLLDSALDSVNGYLADKL
ncbi:alanine--tRNA ligase [Alteromonas halophila]|uniref:Alanine--tRNA ligase n=1 Tax=Alteromonas halophila TaxID=516698 RepID=A0A918JC95_9ALTE|nr:alanine--tRNA ligase [Alteromonas halophila]GGW73898.1 alanine--tRNA ligase [Alteromonas halophila]